MWDVGSHSSSADTLRQDSMSSFARQSEALTTYTVRHVAQLLIAIALFGSLTAGLYWARRRCRALAASENANSPVLNTPIAAALVLTLLFSGWILPQPPRFLQAILGALALVASVWIVRRLIPIEFRSVPYALLACFMRCYLEHLRAENLPGYLETDKPENIEFYEKFGFVVEHEEELIGTPTWYMWREPE